MADVRAAVGAGTGPDPLAAVDAALRSVTGGLRDAACDLAFLAVSSAYLHAFEALATRVREVLTPRHVLGVTAEGVIAGAAELETASALSLWAAHLPGTTIASLRYEPAGDGGTTWVLPPDDARAMVLLADPFSFPAPGFLSWLAQARPTLPVTGGLASAAIGPGGNRLLLGEAVHDDGGVALALGGQVSVRTLVSQGCRPVGETFIVTRAEGNVIHELAGAPAVQRLRETFAGASPRDRDLLRHGMQLGVVIDEYRSDFGRGDFLVRGVLGADADSGAVAVGDRVRVGQTVQFHVRDATSADEDLRSLLTGFGEVAAPAGLLFTCNGRGARLFGTADHDAAAVHDALGAPALAGMFCAGEIGPVGGRSFLHGFTASLVALDPEM